MSSSRDDSAADSAKPAYVTALEAAYGAASQAGFGSAVFYAPMIAAPEEDAGALERMALDKYRYFVGGLWERYGEDAWMGPWRQVYARTEAVVAAARDIVAELRGITTPLAAAMAVPQILDDMDGAERGRAALSAAYDDPAVTELRVFALGDGEAMSGLLVAGRRAVTGDATFLVFLMD